MTIPFFSGDAGRSLVIRRGTDSYGDEGRRLQYSVGNSWRRYAIAQLVESEKMSVLGNLAAEVAAKITAVFIYLNHIYCRGTALLCPDGVVYLPGNSCNNPVGLIVVNLQPALDEVFHARS
ncbi:MAG: hypothetical protein V7L05_19840 [Nostoc sp.]|uniref:hypothetical protein n=1 Tax=Nostoc sp. TaxID=1180 RepID=UPI002FF519FE